MRFLALSLGAVGSLGVVALGGRTIAADRTALARRAPIAEPAIAAPAVAPAVSAADRVWYGGTLAPIVGNVSMDKRHPPPGLERRDRLEITRVRERVEHSHAVIRMPIQPIVHEVAADEAGAARDKQITHSEARV